MQHPSFKLFVEKDMMGFQQQQGPRFRDVAKGAMRVAAKAIPGVGMAMDVGEELQKLWQAKQAGQDIKPLIMKMMAVADNLRSKTSQNVFDLDDPIADSLSDRAREAIANDIVARVMRVPDVSKLPPNMANIVAMKYMMGIFKPYFKNFQAQQQAAQQPQ